MSYDVRWDYPKMGECANRLDGLAEESVANKKAMDKAFEGLAQAAQSQVGQAFLAAYDKHVASILLFSELLQSEAKLLRDNSNAMQEVDAEIAAWVRKQFMV